MTGSGSDPFLPGHGSLRIPALATMGVLISFCASREHVFRERAMSDRRDRLAIGGSATFPEQLLHPARPIRRVSRRSNGLWNEEVGERHLDPAQPNRLPGLPPPLAAESTVDTRISSLGVGKVSPVRQAREDLGPGSRARRAVPETCMPPRSEAGDHDADGVALRGSRSPFPLPGRPPRRGERRHADDPQVTSLCPDQSQARSM